MSKLLYCALFIALTTLLACSGPETGPSATTAPVEAPGAPSIPTPTTAPVEAPAPAEAPAPTEIREPTSTPIPTPTAAPPETTPESGTLAPLDMNSPEAFMSQLSKGEQSCISETGDPGQVLMLMSGPGPGSPQDAQDVQDAQELVRCLGDETLLRLFITGLTGQTGPLSAETSTCVRRGFQDFDIAAVLLSSSMGPGGEGAAMMGGMAGLVLTLSCLNEEEWKIASSRLGLGPDDRESLQCVTSRLGGPEGVAAAMQPRDGGPPTAYINAAAECGLQTAGPPGPRKPGTPSPAGMNGAGLLISDLSDAELSCLSEIGDPQQLVTLMNSPDIAPPQERDALVECLEHETLLKIFLKGFTDQTGPLSDDTSACVSAGFRDFDLRAMMLTNPEGSGGQAAMVKGMAGILITLSCLNEEEWQAASPALDLQPDGREGLQCVMNMLGGPEGVAASLESKEGEPPLALFNAAAECGLTMMGGPPG
jgi:hypothetical protein